MAVSITISIDQNSQNVANNTSNVTVAVRASWTGGSHNHLAKSGWLKIDGVTYNFTSGFNTGNTTSGIQVLYSKTLTIKHNADGTKTLACSASYTSGVSSGTVGASASKVLTTIPRKSALSVSDGTLGTAQTLKITENDSSFAHKLYYTCGNSGTVYILGSSSATSASLSTSWTPPLALSKQNANGITVTIKFTLDTYSGSTLIGSNSYTKTFTIPESVKPTCSISVTDPTGIADRYGSMVKGLSKFKVVVTPTLAYDSAISSYKTTANGVTYTNAAFTTGFLNSSGSLVVTAKVTDKRARSGSDTESIQVLDYSIPTIIRLTVKRCDEDGTENDQGEYVQVTFSAAVSSLNNLNSATYTLKYKRASDSEFIEVGLDEYSDAYSVTDGVYTFPADSGSSYNVEFYITDNHNTTKRTTTASTGFTLMHWNKEGNGIGIGKIAESQDLFDIGLPTRFNAPVYGKVLGMDRLPAIPSNSDFNDYMEPGCYAVQSNAIAETCANIPINRAGRLEVWSATGEGVRIEQWSYLRQRFIPYNSTNAVWERDVARGPDNIWKYYDWWRNSLTPSISEKIYSKAAMTISLPSSTTLGVLNTYTTIPLNTIAISTSDRLTMASNGIRIGADIQYVKVSANAIVDCGTKAGNRHMRIEKVSGSTIARIAWACVYSSTASNTLFSFPPMITSVKEGDILRMMFYTGDVDDVNVSGASSNGWQTYLTVEEL